MKQNLGVNQWPFRKLYLQLKKDRGVFSDGYQMELSNGTLVDYDLSFLYSGTVKGMNLAMARW